MVKRERNIFLNEGGDDILVGGIAIAIGLTIAITVDAAKMGLIKIWRFAGLGLACGMVGMLAETQERSH
jgi:hypothetical protein